MTAGAVSSQVDGRLREPTVVPRPASKQRMVSRVLLIAVLLLSAGLSRPPALERFEAVEPHMGTLVRITVYAPDEAAARLAFRAGFDRIAALDATLSDYLPESELSRITREAVGRPVRVSDDLWTVLAASRDLATATDGAFDVTQGPVIRLWREARRAGRLPDPEALEAAASRSGDRHMTLDAAQRTVVFDRAGMALDVGGIGKGYAASEALAAIAAHGIRQALVAVSGDLAFSDAPPGQAGWRIRVHREPAETSPVPPVLLLTHAAVSTSGNLEQHLDVDGRRYSHVIDPSSRQGLTDDITVTVIAPRGIDADGLDTAMGLVGRARGLALVERHPEAAALIVERAGGRVEMTASTRLKALVAAQPTPPPAR